MKIEYPLNFIKSKSNEETKEILESFLELKKYVLITGKTSSKNISNKLIDKKKFKPHDVHEIDSANHDEIDLIADSILKENINFVVSVGGGVVVDFAKRLALLTKTQLLSIPTVVSNDGMASPISVLNLNSKKVSLPGKLPDVIVVPINIIEEAPKKYLRAAILDTLSNLSAINDWKFADDDISLNHSNSMAINLANIAATMVLNIKNLELHDKRILECALDVQLLSGMAMTICGSSRPCSGSEHIISHALDYMGIEQDILHGEKVGTISEFTIFVQGDIVKEASKLLRKLEIEKGIPGLKYLNEKDAIDFFDFAKELRPDRVTILDKYSAKELYKLHLDFLET